MNLISEKGKVFALITPSRLIIRPESLDVRRINREFQRLSLDKAEALSNKIDKDFIENLLTESFSEIMKGIVLRSFTVRETAEVSQSSIKTELFSKVSLRGGKTEINEKESLEEGLRVIPFAPFIAVTVFDKAVDEGEINRVEQYLQGVIGWDDRGKFKVNKIELPVSFHSKTSVWN
jgi:hypothetical protein